jgi:hypothetical protein
MRVLALVALATASFAVAAPAQQSVDSAKVAPAPTMDGRLRTEIMLLRTLFGSIHAPAADSFRVGRQEIGAGTTHQGTVAVARGDLSVRGRIVGDAIAVHGDVVVYPGGSVSGNAISVDGRVRSLGGVVEGDMRSIRGITGSILSRAAGQGPSSQPLSTWDALKMVLGWFAVLFVIGVGVLLFAEKNLDGVVVALEQQFSRAFWVGVLTQLAAIPALLLVLIALAVSLIGILLIPFAVVAFVIALAGLLTLGFLAVARFTGRAFSRGPRESRAVHLRALLTGLIVYLGLWFLAAAFVWHPVAGSVLRAVALAGCWVALTIGLGATILTRAGTRREDDRARAKRPAADDLSWQTPTPVTGVVAARRPIVTAKEG